MSKRRVSLKICKKKRMECNDVTTKFPLPVIKPKCPLRRKNFWRFIITQCAETNLYAK